MWHSFCLFLEMLPTILPNLSNQLNSSMSNKDLSNYLRTSTPHLAKFMSPSNLNLFPSAFTWPNHLIKWSLKLAGGPSGLDSRFILLRSETITVWLIDHRLLWHTCLAYLSFQQLAMQTQTSPTERELFTQTLPIYTGTQPHDQYPVVLVVYMCVCVCVRIDVLT